MNEITKAFFRSEYGRKWIIKKLTERGKNKKLKIQRPQWQEYHTPYDLCKTMICRRTPHKENNKTLILFNLELLEVLINIYKINSKDITFISDSNLEGRIAERVYKISNFKIAKNISEFKEVIHHMDLHFDLCITNPPYTGNMDANIITEVLPLCTEIIIVHPAAWLLDNKILPNSYFTKYRKLIENYSESAYIFDGNSAFNIIGPCSPFTIFKINKNHKGRISVNYFNKISYNADTIYDITDFTNDWEPIVKPFVELMKKQKNIWDSTQRIKDNSNPPLNKFYFKCRSMVPGTMGNDIWNCLIQNNKNYQEYIVTYNNLELNRKSARIRYYFKTFNEILNFIDYLKTDFVRFCIHIYKSNQHFDSGELLLVPWMDFNRFWSDNDLYNHFNIPQQTRDYITNFFADDIFCLR
jgi:hypothetical protein